VYSEKAGLETIQALCEHFGNPQNDYNIIHVAGTNGKGSVSTKCAKALTTAGYRTGLFTSPHLFSFRERMRVDHEPISKADVVQIMDEIVATGIQVKFFEIITVMSFIFFKRA
jgi:dihydrofolate synthase/folylpolyglutamate synthase